MTLEEIKGSKKQYLTPAEAAPLLGTDPQSLRVAARTAPQRLGFPVTVIGTRTKIPRLPLLKHLGIQD